MFSLYMYTLFLSFVTDYGVKPIELYGQLHVLLSAIITGEDK